MISLPRAAQLFFIFLATITIVQPARSVSQNEVSLSTLEEIKSEFASVPCKDQDRMKSVVALFKRMGATDAEVLTSKSKGTENVVVRKRGESQELLVIGAHYDKVSEGCGAVDNWTGIVVLAHLFKSINTATPTKTILFVAFDHEEDGLRGSQAMVDAIDKNDLQNYCAMINVDSLGLAGPQVLDNASSSKLAKLVAETARDSKMAFMHATIAMADADSSSFIARKIPAVTIHGLNSGWLRILHTDNDQASQIKPLNVYLGYRLILSTVVRLDSASCAAYR